MGTNCIRTTTLPSFSFPSPQDSYPMPRDSWEDFSPFSVTAADFLNSSLSPLIDTGWQGPKDTISPLFLLTHQHSFQVSRLHPLYSATLFTISFCPPQFFSSQLSPSPSEFSPVELSVPTMTHLIQWHSSTHSVLILPSHPATPDFWLCHHHPSGSSFHTLYPTFIL